MNYMTYMTPIERKRFREGIAAAKISFFRIGKCKLCGEDVYKDFDYCSIKCAQKAKELGMEQQGFVGLVARFLGKKVVVETRDGVYLRGKLTSIETLVLKVNHSATTVPVALRLDDDSEKVIELTRISEITCEA